MIIYLHHDIFFFLILILVFVSRMLVRALWHFNEQTNPIPQRIVHGTTIEIIRTIFRSVILLFIAIPSFGLALIVLIMAFVVLFGVQGIAFHLGNENVADLNVLVMTNAPNEGDFPIDQPPVGGLPDLQQEMAHAAHPEDIIAELTSKVERIFHEVGTPLPLEEGESARSFTENHVLWNSEGGDTLQQIFFDYTEAGDASEFVAIATNLAKRFRRAELGEPDSPDPDAPLEEQEAHSTGSPESTKATDGANEAGPSSSQKRKRWDDDSGSEDDDSGGPGESPDPVEIVYEGDAQGYNWEGN
ncbi:unnamed protein product [Triticum turgidum subsp. durum]|uniref:Cytochrome oxidase subunit II transmembrane region profile domain-containing protein n=1 Tax=Triticum turgidum subsp. durum TaxID=4567 RepID=A0A9R1RUD3_TRITD|nr:unnamed protein product [Triticum turgidum subsp. durum]